MKSKSHVLAFI